jgi:hypothetical protein
MQHDGPITSITTSDTTARSLLLKRAESLPNRASRASHAQNGLGGVRLDVLDHGEQSRKRSRSRLLPAGDRYFADTARERVPPCRSDLREKPPFGRALTRTVLVAGAGFEPASRGPFLRACQHRFLRLGDGPSAAAKLDGELISGQVADQLLLRGEPRRRRSGERAPVELVAV